MRMLNVAMNVVPPPVFLSVEVVSRFLLSLDTVPWELHGGPVLVQELLSDTSEPADGVAALPRQTQQPHEESR